MAANMCFSQYKACRKFVFEHPASSSSWSLPCVKRLADLSGIYSVDFDGMRLFTNSRTTDGLVDRRTATDRVHDLQDAFIGKRRCADSQNAEFAIMFREESLKPIQKESLLAQACGTRVRTWTTT